MKKNREDEKMRVKDEKIRHRNATGEHPKMTLHRKDLLVFVYLKLELNLVEHEKELN